MNKLKLFVKQLFCRHDYKKITITGNTKLIYDPINDTTTRYEFSDTEKRECTKCGKIKE